ncbi:MAG: UDP-N-acetylmuramate dehydrogenase [Vibrio sp.]
MNVSQNLSLKAYHTFGVELKADYVAEFESVDDLISAYQNPSWQSLPKLVVGKGSNILFTQDYQGVVLVNRIQGIEVTSQDSDIHLHVAAGEDWPSLVQWSIEQGYAGLENLALIPGCAGSAPIQNIGAYGVELKDVCEYVDYLDLADMTVKRFAAQDCQFGYRDSIFKHDLYQKAVIVAVGLKLTTNWQPKLSYGPLKAVESSLTTPKAVFDKICEIRRSKLPDPAKLGNAGSFFKNPVISQEKFAQLQQAYPELGGYPAEGGVKIAAGWLIDQCGLKGYQVGGAQVHKQQALVLTNAENATASDVLQLAQDVKTKVYAKYGVTLEHEVRFMGATDETRLEMIFSTPLA